jgi:hypothetical protein
MYGIWNLVAGTYGIFFPYILDAVGSTSDRATLALQAIWFVSTALAVGFVYMPLIDRVNRRVLLAWSTVLQLAAFVPFIFFDATFLTSLINVVLFGAGAGIGQQSLFQLWSGELFPTLLRSTAQGFMFGVVRIALGGWLLLLPKISGLGLQHAVGDPVRAAAGERPGRHPLRARHHGARPRGDAGGADAAAALRPPRGGERAGRHGSHDDPERALPRDRPQHACGNAAGQHPGRDVARHDCARRDDGVLAHVTRAAPLRPRRATRRARRDRRGGDLARLRAGSIGCRSDQADPRPDEDLVADGDDPPMSFKVQLWLMTTFAAHADVHALIRVTPAGFTGRSDRLRSPSAPPTWRGSRPDRRRGGG